MQHTLSSSACSSCSGFNVVQPYFQHCARDAKLFAPHWGHVQSPGFTTATDEEGCVEPPPLFVPPQPCFQHCTRDAKLLVPHCGHVQSPGFTTATNEEEGCDEAPPLFVPPQPCFQHCTRDAKLLVLHSGHVQSPGFRKLVMVVRAKNVILTKNKSLFFAETHLASISTTKTTPRADTCCGRCSVGCSSLGSASDGNRQNSLGLSSRRATRTFSG